MYIILILKKCKTYNQREGCYKEGCKTKFYNVSIKTSEQEQQIRFQETPDFKDKAKEGYKIEAKNAEIKQCYGYDKANYNDIEGMQMQGALTIFVTNLKRIAKIIG